MKGHPMNPFPRPHWKKRAEALRDFLESHGFKVEYTTDTAEVIGFRHSRLPTSLPPPPADSPKHWWRAWWAWGGME